MGEVSHCKSGGEKAEDKQEGAREESERLLCFKLLLENICAIPLCMHSS
jgi:hypothetical protein